MNPYQPPNIIKEKYKRPQVDWGYAAIIFFGFYGTAAIVIYLTS